MVLCPVLLAGCVAAAPQWTTYPGSGASIVLVSGDEEYRSEEALPQLARILSTRHGFECRVVFAIDPETGEINPDVRTNIPGLDALADADLMIIATRFRDLPDEQMRYIDEYVESGRPIVGLRTATHAFALEGSDTYRRHSWNHDTQGFGRQVLGETWIAHHGHHGVESTRGVIASGMEIHPIARGLDGGVVWGPTDVYSVRLPLPDGCEPIVLGQVLAGMAFDDEPLDGPKNDPMMPIAWTRTGDRRVFTTTMGAATDLSAEGTRRMIVNGVYWALGMEDEIPSEGCDARQVGHYEPTAFGFGGFKRGMRPDVRRPLQPGTRLVVAGNTFAERLAQSGVFDSVVHAAHPDHELVIRHVPWSADEVTLRPREHSVPTMLQWIDRLDADVVLLCLGMSESFTQTAVQFEAGLDGLLDRITSARVILVSPIRREDGDNDGVAGITAAMQRVAARRGVPFVDLFDLPRSDTLALTTNGIHPNEPGAAVFAEAIARQLGWLDAQVAGGGDVEALRTLAADQHWLFRLVYRPTNTEYVWGRRHEPFGVVNFPPETTQLERMIAARDEVIRAMDLPSPAEVITHAISAPPIWPTTPSDRVLPQDAWSPAPVEAKGTETSLGSTEIDPPEVFAQSLTLPDGYVIECFASEQDFPELANPLAMAFDARGRLWVLCTPTYPHLMPGTRPHCKLLILEDTDRDGHADRHVVFADGLYIPTGFAIDGDGVVYLGQAPDLLRLVDVDGDDRADTTEILFSGFGMCDSHHQLSAFEWDPAGGLIMNEGVFTKSNVETPHGTRRTRDAGVWRFDPRTRRLDVVSHCSFSNPWGHVVDDYGAAVLADASGGDNHSFTHVSTPYEYPRKPGKPARMSNRGRPTAGCEIISSGHFPDEVQGTFLVNQSIGFHGTRWDRLVPQGSTWTTEPLPDLVTSSDVNFRPVAMEIGPDGALYIVDWCNPIVGHMQYSVRDPRRDHTHGRVWRVRHRDRDLVEPVDMSDGNALQLLAWLRLPERNTRHHARLRLQRMSWDKVGPMLTRWRSTLKPTEPDYSRLRLEDLWIQHAHGRATPIAFERVLTLDEPRARAGAVQVLRYELRAGEIDEHAAAELLAMAVEDPDMRVRLEAVVACGFLSPADGLRLAARADLHDMDEAMRVVFEEVLTHLGRGGDVASDVLDRVKMTRMPADELLALPLDDTSAVATLSRVDLARERRMEALAYLAGPDPDDQAAHLVELLETLGGEQVLRSLGVLLMSMPAALEMTDAADRLAADDDPTRHAVGVAMHLVQDAPADGSPHIVEALALLEPGDAPARTIANLRVAVERGDVEYTPAIEQVVRHDRQADVNEWLVSLALAVEGKPNDDWTPQHERAMAAQRAISALEWSGFDPYRVEAASPEVLAAGREIYHDEVRGCVRCHGPRGGGLDGYPPLDRSPWVLGDPQRAATIVLHGLYGPIKLSDGSLISSAMEPLGALLDDAEVAAVLTYVRQGWGNFGAPVTAEQVAAAREVGHAGMWETRELIRQHPLARDAIVPAPPESSLLRLLGRGAWLTLTLLPAVILILVLERRSRRPGLARDE